MRNILIVKTGAAGDVLRTTYVLKELADIYTVYWLTDPLCVDLIDSNLAKTFTNIHELSDVYFDLVYSLEEDEKLLLGVQHRCKFKTLIGYYISEGTIQYTEAATEWFDMSLNSKYGIDVANQLKMKNTKSFQEMVADIFNLKFTGQKYNYLKFDATNSVVAGDIAIAKTAGNKWPNKNWAYYGELKLELEKLGYSVNYLPNRSSIKEHIADIASHKLVVCGDSLPMHIATALNIPSVALFTCTSPAEIHDYNLITKLVSVKLNSYFYQREFNVECTRSIDIESVLTNIKLIYGFK